MAKRPRRGSRRGRRGSSPWPIVGAIGIAVLAVAAIVAGFVLRPESVARDEATLCPKSGPKAVTTIVVDTTDEVEVMSRTDALQTLSEFVSREAAPDELIMAFETAPVSANALQPVAEVCHPGDPDEADPLVANPRLIQKRLQEGFLAPLTASFEALLNIEEAETSPLMESVQSVSTSVLSRSAYEAIPKRLIIVSDLMQNSERVSFYRGRPDYEAFAATRGAEALQTDLRGVDVTIFFLNRRTQQDIESLELVTFWQKWLKDQGAASFRVIRMQGMN